MRSGRETLQSIEGTISRISAEESQLDSALASAVADAERLRRERSEALKALARVKLDEIKAGRLVANLDAGERKAVLLLEHRRLRLSTIAGEREKALADIEAAQAERNGAHERVEAAVEALKALRAGVETTLMSSSAWIEARKEFEAADAVAAEAEKKALASERELGAKKQPYDEDVLFLYLWKRGYGTRSYSAGNLVRWGDSLVADFIGYLDARPNYAMLIEIPLRLREHASERRKAADQAKSTVEGIEVAAMKAAGSEAAEARLAEARHQLAAADQNVERRKAALAALDTEHGDLIANKGDKDEQAIDIIATADASDDIRTLLAEARRTPTGDDEGIVGRIAAIDEKLGRNETEIAELRKTARDVAQRRLEVERVRDNFRNAGFDHPSTTFGNDRDFDDMLGQLARGAVRVGASVLWDLLRSGYGTRRGWGQPDFGGMTFPFPFPLPRDGRDNDDDDDDGNRRSRGGAWRRPRSSGDWSPLPGPFGSSGGGSWGGGGSSSGGGSSNDGGGFRTGGSF